MARTNRKSTPTVRDILLKEPYRFEFHQAIKLLEYLYPSAKPFGETVNPLDEVVTVKSRVYLESMASDIYSLENLHMEMSSPYKPPILNVNFMGIAGIQGPLPFPYTEMIIQRQRNGDYSLKDFFDIFNHRLISILHRIRKQYLISLNTCLPEKTEIAVGLRSFLGLGARALQNRLHVPDRSLLDYAGFYWTHPHSAQGLERILANYFHIPIRVEKCIGLWRSIPQDQQTRIGRKGRWQKLGEDAAIGKRVWDQNSHFRLHIGPIDVTQLDLFLPEGKCFERLKDLTNLYADSSMDYSIYYIVKSPPSTCLGKKSYLGWRSWLGTSLKVGDPVRIMRSRIIDLL